MYLSDNVRFIIERLNAFGHRADVVGGPVRDFLRGVEPSDYDITTSALPEETKTAFSDCKTVDTGIKHGTVSLILDGVPYEITTYRIDGEYKDSRHPETVTFTQAIEEDLARRDFTMNAIAYNPHNGITDVFGGAEDIKNKIIRAVGEAELRFSEDALRILRALRFSATLGFEIEEKTAKALCKKSYLLREISAERIYSEWKKLLSGRYAYKILEKYSEVISIFIPELSSLRLPQKDKFADEYILRAVQIFQLSCIEPHKAFEKAMARLKTDTNTRKLGECILKNLSKYRLNTLADAGIMLSELGDEVAPYCAKVDYLLSNITKDDLLRVDEYLNKALPYKISQLAVNGDDLKSCGLCGAEIGKQLSLLLRAVISGEVENDREKLLAYIKPLKM